MEVKRAIRKLCRIRENETFISGIERYYIQIQKKICKKKYSKEELGCFIRKLGLENGDIVMVHSSWRRFFNFEGTPEDVIDILREIIGKEGTILMPSYGCRREYFDINNTPSNAGIITEVFRKKKNVIRSWCPHFSIAAQGPLADNLLRDHVYSEYGFDTFSPIYKLAKIPKAKILFLGLGKKPTKNSIFHCAGYVLKEEDQKLNRLLSNTYDAILVVDGKERIRHMIFRQQGHKNNNIVFRKIFDSIQNKKTEKLSNLYGVCINAEEALERAIEYTQKGIYCYKRMRSV